MVFIDRSCQWEVYLCIKTLSVMNRSILRQVPITEEEAFRILDEVYTLREKESAIDKDKAEFCTDEHFGLGLWIRNHWIYRPESNDPDASERFDKCLEMLSGCKPGELMFPHPDSISDAFLEKYYDHLKGFVASSNEPVPVSRKPVKCPHCGGRIVPIVYGEPGPEMMASAERGEIILGGCCIVIDGPDYACAVCGQRFRKEQN